MQSSYVGESPIAHHPTELYNLEVDPSEKFNIAAEESDVFIDIMNLVNKYKEEVIRREGQLAPVGRSQKRPRAG